MSKGRRSAFKTVLSFLEQRLTQKYNRRRRRSWEVIKETENAYKLFVSHSRTDMRMNFLAIGWLNSFIIIIINLFG